MAFVSFTTRLRSVVAGSPMEVDGATIGDALVSVFLKCPQARGYVLDEQGMLRKHVCVFLDGERLANDVALAAPLRKTSEIYVMQALSGG